MTFSLVLQAIFAGVTNGIVYALVGMGLSAIFKGSRVINAMQGEFSVIGAMATVLLLTQAGWPYAAAIAAGALLGALLGAAIEIAFVRYMARQNATEDSFLLLTIGLALTLSASVLFFVGRDGHLLPPLGGEGVLIVLDAVIQIHAVWLIAIGVAATLLLRAFFHHTMVGLSMMAASIDPDGAATTGINVGRMRTFTFVLGGFLGALGGILVTPLVAVDYQLGLGLTLKGFAAAVLGGLTNPLGAAVGGVTLGLVESLAIIGVSSSYKDVVAFSVLIVIMILMPQGILGRAGRRGG
ncbi:branched-chain amino acid ABC transporter permease [Vineibacter terrae]|uniref:branched-chain amino acid ABC transporter permease n=1 Tax=Vineibacter terrae TaxID=2586908 RepID=UPI002E2F22BD|nr:branched-chain amino acid ABC transporter permease [Vineibacter terrae]HEX2890333.1 branched-chain amino acid ABC transporter permease [Vineibacter terrae]